jgi:hypothetical protein
LHITKGCRAIIALMQGKTKPISLEEIKKIEMKNDGKDFQRFNALLKQVISVPREEILRREKAEKKAKEKKS